MLILDKNKRNEEIVGFCRFSQMHKTKFKYSYVNQFQKLNPKKCFSRERRHLACEDCAGNLKLQIIGNFGDASLPCRQDACAPDWQLTFY